MPTPCERKTGNFRDNGERTRMSGGTPRAWGHAGLAWAAQRWQITTASAIALDREELSHATGAVAPPHNCEPLAHGAPATRPKSFISKSIPIPGKAFSGLSSSFPAVGGRLPGPKENGPGDLEALPASGDWRPGLRKGFPGVPADFPGLHSSVPGHGRPFPAVRKNHPVSRLKHPRPFSEVSRRPDEAPQCASEMPKSPKALSACPKRLDEKRAEIRMRRATPVLCPKTIL